MRQLAEMMHICKSDCVLRMVVKFHAASTVLRVNSIKKQYALFYDCPSFFGVNSDSPPDISNSAVITFMSVTTLCRVMSCSVLFLAGLLKIRMHFILHSCELNNMDVKKHWLRGKCQQCICLAQNVTLTGRFIFQVSSTHSSQCR